MMTMKQAKFVLATVALLAIGTTEMATAKSSSHLRADFVHAMDRATGKQQEQHQHQEQETFLSRLAQVATPAAEYPAYMKSLDDEHRHLEEWSGFAVNLTEYALKYVGCSNIKTWSDDMAEDGDNSYDTVLKTERFVVLRLCPRDSCSNYNRYGCMEQYGDYLIPMEIYLQIMAETFFAQYQEYCETCYECMSAFNGDDAAGNNYNNNNGDDQYSNNAANGDDAFNNNNNNNNGGRRQLYDDAYYNNAAANDDANANGADDDFYNYYQNNANQGGGCEYYSVCENYESACQDYSNVADDLQQYFQCSEFYIGNSLGYLGPHCKADGKTIGLGIFHDENCYQFNADLQDMSTYMAVSDNDLEAYYSNNCISCLASDGYTLEVDNNGDGYGDVSDICGALYDESAKCNRYMGNLGDYSSENQEATENSVCNFIHNLVTNSYDEYGEIYLKTDSWTEYLPNINEMPQWQKYILSTVVLSCVGLFAYACYLHRQITQRRFVWYPRSQKGYSSKHSMIGPRRLSQRGHSGIIQGRSQSSTDFEMKDGGVMG